LYIRDKNLQSDVLFLGIFSSATNEHIGNIKFEPVNSTMGYAVMGMLIGERAWRGQGAAGEVLDCTATWLRKNRAIKQILLGVQNHNLPAIRAYEKVGF
jgi:[ribosomal protein S5]-alanine N-acetyltransferase